MTIPKPELFPSAETDLPDGWTAASLDSLLTFTLGGDWGGEPKDNLSLEEVRVNVIRGTEFRNWDRDKGSTGAKRVIKISSLTKRKLLLGDIVVEISGGGPDQPVGRTLVIDTESLQRADAPLVCSNFCRQIRPSIEIESEFLNYLLRFKYSTGEFDHFQTQTTNLRNLNFGAFLSGVTVPTAPIAEQRRIVGKVEELLASAHAVRERLVRTTKLLKRFRQSVLAAACSGRLTADWRIENPDVELASALLARILREKNPPRPLVPARSSPPGGARSQQKLAFTDDSGLAPPIAGGGGGSEHLTFNERVTADELTELPEEWCWATIGQLAQIRGGMQKQPRRAPVNNSFPYLRVANVLRGRLDLREISKFELFGDELNTYRLEAEDLLIVEGNGSFSEIGRSAIWSGEIPDCVHQNHIIRVRFKQCSSRYVDYFWNSSYGISLVTAQAVTSSGLYSLSTGKVAALPVPLPPFAEQQEIVRRVERLFSLADAIERRVAEAAARADKLTQAVLAKAFRGELVPTEAELARQEGRAYEPASMLLERVRAERVASPPRPSRSGREKRTPSRPSP